MSETLLPLIRILTLNIILNTLLLTLLLANMLTTHLTQHTSTTQPQPQTITAHLTTLEKHHHEFSHNTENRLRRIQETCHVLALRVDLLELEVVRLKASRAYGRELEVDGLGSGDRVRDGDGDGDGTRSVGGVDRRWDSRSSSESGMTRQIALPNSRRGRGRRPGCVVS